MNVLGNVAVAVALMAPLTACSPSGGDTAVPAGTSSAAAPSASAVAPAPRILAGDDARVLLRPSGDRERLAIKVLSDLDDLVDVHVEDRITGGDDLRLSFDASGARCVGTLVESGLAFRFVSTDHDRILLTTSEGELGQRLAGRWISAPGSRVGKSCGGGLIDVVLGTKGLQSGPAYFVEGARRVGVETVAGRRAIHFHDVDDATSVVTDSWIGSSGSRTRLLRLQWHRPDGSVETVDLSGFDASPPRGPRPAPSQVLTMDGDQAL